MPWLSLSVVAGIAVGAVLILQRYNALVRARKRVQEAWSGVDVQLKRRNSLLPNLVETVKGYAAHERDLFEEVARARSALQGAATAGETAMADSALKTALGRLLAIVESYPTLHASENFMSLRSDLSDVEEKIAFARQFYNRNVLDYNTRLETVPDSIVAALFAFRPVEFFEAAPAERSDYQVSFAKDATPKPPATATQQGGSVA
jgi:LemA protein